MEKAKIDRINFLARKSKSEGLTEPEVIEQAALRREYIDEYRQGLRAQLENTYIVDPGGNKRKLKSSKEKM